MRLLCIDGNSVMNRAFYGIKLLTTKDGKYTNAIYGFLNIFIKLMSTLEPQGVAVAFDLSDKTFRHNMYASYKATRKGMPEELAQQMQPLKDILSALGYKIVTCRGFEADDILGTLARACSERGDECFLATGDRDSLQLVDDKINVLLTITKFGKGETETVDTASFTEKHGFAPPILVDLKALMGDSSDNIPGVPGVGEKTAMDLLHKFGTLDGVYENIHSSEIKDSVRKKLIDGKDSAYLSYKLATINREVPVETDFDAYLPGHGNPADAAALLNSFEMHSLITKLDLGGIAPSTKRNPDADTPAEPELIEVETALFAGIPSGTETAYITENAGKYYCIIGNIPYSLDRDALSAILGNGVPLFCHNAKRLYHTAADLGLFNVNIVFDTLLAAYLMNPSAGNYSPALLADEYGAKKAFLNDEVPGYFPSLCDKLAAALESSNMKDLHDNIELPLSKVLCDMENAGFKLDIKSTREFGNELKKLMDQEQQAVYNLCGRSFNINSPKQLGDVLFNDLGLPVIKKTKSGYSTNAEVLEKLRVAHPIVSHVLNYRMYQKLTSTYVEGLIASADPEGIIRTEFMQTETRTGRISSREPNLQNIPVRSELGSNFRKFFVARGDRILLDADYSQIELRVLASVSDDKQMISAFNSGNDIHTETASRVFGVPPIMVTSELRRRAKAVNFGIVYGIGAFSLADDIGCSMREAKEYIEGYLATYSSVAAYLDNAKKSAREKGYTTTMFGRRRMIPELASSNKTVQALGERLAMNTPIQGTAADIIKIAMINVSKRLKEEGLDADLILQIHDELIVETSHECADRAAVVLREEMEKATSLAAPLVAEVGRGKSWYDAKD